MQNSICKINELLFNSPPRCKTADKFSYKNSSKISFQPSMNTLYNERSISKEKNFNNSNSRRCSKTEDKFYLIRASQPLNNIALNIASQIEKPVFSQYQDLSYYKNTIRNVAYAKIMQKFNFFHTRNASRDTSKTPIFSVYKESPKIKIKNNKTEKLQVRLNNQKYSEIMGRKQDKILNYSMMNFKSDKRKNYYKEKSNQNNQSIYEESIVFKINPYLDSSSKFILDKFRENFIKKRDTIENSKNKSKNDSESALRFLMPIFNLKFAENKAFFRKILQNPSIMEKQKKVQEKLYLNKERYKSMNSKTKSCNQNNLSVHVKRKGTFSSIPSKNHPIIHKSSKIDLAEMIDFGEINIKQW